LDPGNANLAIGGLKAAIQENGVPRIAGLQRKNGPKISVLRPLADPGAAPPAAAPGRKIDL